MQIDPIEVYDLFKLAERSGPFLADPTLSMEYFEMTGMIAKGTNLNEKQWSILGQSFAQIEALDPFLWNILKETAVNRKNKKVLEELYHKKPKNADVKYLKQPLFAASPLSRVMMRHTRELLEIYRQNGELRSNLAKRNVRPVCAIPFTPEEKAFYELLEDYCNGLEEQVRKSIEACGAILYLPENRLEAELLTEQLQKCLKVLLTILRENRLTVTGCEQRITKDMGMIKTEEGWDMIGFIDMTLEDENHHPVIFDFKWTSSKSYYRDLLEANRSIQLELYRTMLSAEKRDAVERVAYFLMPESHLYSLEHFEGLHCTQLEPANSDNIVEQLKNAFFYRKKQIDSGQIEIGEGFPCGMLDYYNATEADSLFPLNVKDGQQETNIFSNYTIFKGLKEGE